MVEEGLRLVEVGGGIVVEGGCGFSLAGSRWLRMVLRVDRNRGVGVFSGES